MPVLGDVVPAAVSEEESPSSAAFSASLMKTTGERDVQGKHIRVKLILSR